jgi:uncharacterized protein (TIGR02444 family)
MITAADSTANQRTNPFWQFSLRVYEDSQVAETCLMLQDTLGVDVNLLLYCAWRGYCGELMSSGRLQEAEEGVQQWRDRVVEPLRSLRRELQGLRGVESVREQVKAAELEAERVQQELLWGLSGGDEQLPGEHCLQANLGLLASWQATKSAVRSDSCEATWTALAERMNQRLGG